MERGQHRCEDLPGGVESMSWTWPTVQAVGNGIENDLAVHRQVRALGQVLAQQSVGVFTGAALPGAMRVAEVDLPAGVGGQFRMPGHLLALVVGQGLAHRCGNQIEIGGKAGQR